MQMAWPWLSVKATKTKTRRRVVKKNQNSPLKSWDRCYDFKNIFTEKFGEDIGVFDSKQS
jgi:hypothetical protein